MLAQLVSQPYPKKGHPLLDGDTFLPLNGPQFPSVPFAVSNNNGNPVSCRATRTALCPPLICSRSTEPTHPQPHEYGWAVEALMPPQAGVQ